MYVSRETLINCVRYLLLKKVYVSRETYTFICKK